MSSVNGKLTVLAAFTRSELLDICVSSLYFSLRFSTSLVSFENASVVTATVIVGITSLLPLVGTITTLPVRRRLLAEVSKLLQMIQRLVCSEVKAEGASFGSSLESFLLSITLISSSSISSSTRSLLSLPASGES